MPRVLRILNRFNLGGPSFNAAYLSKHLSPEFETLLIGGIKNEDEDSSEFIFHDMGLHPHVISCMKRSVNPMNDLRAYRSIISYIRAFKPDIVHTHAAKAGALGRMAAIRMKVPVIVHTYHGHVFHSYFGSFKTQLIRHTERFLARKTDCIIAISNKQKQELVHTFHICNADQTRIIPLGFDLSRFADARGDKRTWFRKKFNLRQDELAIGMIGRLAPVKNHKLFIEGLAQVINEEHIKIKAFIIGDGHLRNELELLAERLSIKNYITFTSWVRDIDKVYAGLDIVALTSDNEGTPVSLIEAQAAGRPVISSRVGGVEDVVEEGITGMLFEKGDMHGFARCVKHMMHNHFFLEQTATELVKAKFHYTKLLENIRKLYWDLLMQTGRI